MTSRQIRSLVIAFAAVALAIYLLALVGLRLTWSGSVPRGLYLAVGRPVDRGAIVLACLPEDVGRWAVGRGYLPTGSCPGEAAPVGKPVAGRAGDRVRVDEHGIAINGRRLCHSRRVSTDSAGRPMPWTPAGEYRLATDEIWLYSEHHRRSLDSRIYGPLRLENVRELLVPIWVEGSP